MYTGKIAITGPLHASVSPQATPHRETRLRSSGRPNASTLALACAAALAFSAATHAQETAQQTQQPATAQQGEATDLDKVEVIGFRHAIATSIQTKNESTSIVESISAEDIGKMPDISIADSISRLPGLTMQRIDGRSQVIHIRGMSEQFAGTLLNGREQVTTGDNRGVEFDQYPAELINSVVVYKTPDASLVGQGISGTVDMRTVRPLDIGKRRIVISGQGEKNSLGGLTDGGKDTGYRFSASYVDQFADDTFGVAVGVTRLASPFQEKHYKSWWWANTDVWGGSQTGKPADAIALQGAEGWVKSRDTTRDGVMAVLEFKPNDTWHSVLDMYHSKFEQTELMRGVMWTNDPWWNGGAADYTVANTTDYHGTPVVTSGTLSGIQPVVRNDSNLHDGSLSAFGWNNQFKWDVYTLTADVSYSRAKVDKSLLETYAGRLGGLSVDFQIPLSPGYADYALPDLSDPNSVYLSDPQGWGHDGKMEDSQQKDTLKSFRVSMNRLVDSYFLPSYDVGFNYSKRTKSKEAQVYFTNLPGRTPTLVDPSLLAAPTALGFAGMGDVLAYDARALLSRYYDVSLNEQNSDLQKDGAIEETIKTFYAKANLDFDVSDTVRVRGNVGVQYIKTEQASQGVYFDTSTDPDTMYVGWFGTSYGDILPSLNLVADFGNGWNVRFGAARELMRPRINDMGAYANVGVSTDTHEWSGNGGNPALEPYRANSVDLSVEKYFGESNSSYIALAAFYKNLDSFVYNQKIPYNFAGRAYDASNPPVSDWGLFSTPANGSGGYMRGAELGMALGGDLISSALDGFGLLLNASYTESSIDPDGPNQGSDTDTIPGLSTVVANATLYYEKNGFAARISQRFRDPYRGEYASIFGARSYRYTLNERTVDLQLSYDFPETSALSGLSLLAQVNNVTNEPFRTQVTAATDSSLWFPEEYTEYGRQYLIGARYSF